MDKRYFGTLLMIAFCMSATLRIYGQKPRQMEKLSRGVVAVNQSEKVFVGWRMFGTDAENIAFNLYRTTDGGKAVKLNDQPIADVTFFVDENADLNKTNAYFVRPVLNKKEQAASAQFTLKANTPVRQYLSIPLQTPTGYAPNDASVGVWMATANTRSFCTKPAADVTIHRLALPIRRYFRLTNSTAL